MAEARQSLRVMVVDDERGIADSLALILRSYAYATRVVYCAEDAVLVAQDFQPQIVISDVMMPGMTGIDLAIWFADHQPTCKVLLVTGNNQAFQMVEDSIGCGHVHTIWPKPIHPTKILEFIASCVPMTEPTKSGGRADE